VTHSSLKSMYTLNQLRETNNEEKVHILNIYISGIWLVTLTGKPLDKYYIKDRLEIERYALLEEAFDLKKVTALE
jgi:hypothetical protein